MDAKARPVFRAQGAVLAPATLWNELLCPPPVPGGDEMGSGDEGHRAGQGGVCVVSRAMGMMMRAGCFGRGTRGGYTVFVETFIVSCTEDDLLQT